ncbi:type II secretion system GspH family protein [Stieleria sp. TO1_6]|uniref:type II secretion system protein n=1 Tax=Stieleria tagensis TaxID=2956795 RepID=UPI00209B2350|nr:type II secretion system protein [Stieleria tagensis]MCO8121980.1 type II secretion system GspH family protein [Stieleria tagensis]
MRRTRSQQRFLSLGFSLLEMLLALAILGTSLAMLAQIAESGVSAAREARALASARMICQGKLSDLLLNVAGGQTPATIIDAPAEAFDSETTETYQYSTEVMQGQLDGMLSVRVTVKVFAGDGGTPLATYALDRWVIDPTLGLEAAEAEEAAAREEIASGGEEAVE